MPQYSCLSETVFWLYSQRYESKKLNLAVTNHLQHESIKKFFSFSNGQHINEHSGVKQNVVNNGTTSIKNQIDQLFSTLFLTGSSFVISLVVLFFCSFYIGLIFLGVGTLFCFLMYRLNKRLTPGVRKIRDKGQRNSRLISELYRFVTSVKIENQEEKSLDDVSSAQEAHHTVFIQTWMPTVSYLSMIRTVTSIMRFSAMFVVVYLVFHRQFLMGSMFLVFTYSNSFIVSIWQLMDMQQNFLIDRINIEKYFELLEVTSDICIPENPIKIKNFYGAIEFRNVTFFYPKRVNSYEFEGEEGELMQDDPILKSVSFKIYEGEKVGFVGESGSGKSTIANLIRRAFDPQMGQILIDGHDLRLLDLKDYLRRVGSVEQDVVMFDRSIRDNILFGTEKASLVTDERLHELAKIARIDAFFSRLEHGFDTVVGEKGVKLSGGERQRVGIARALAKKPVLMIFDEATSALDAVSEKIVQQSIDEASVGRTTIVIAHRLSTIMNCDRIFVFRHGILLAEGTHNELLEKCEYYSELVHNQMISA